MKERIKLVCCYVFLWMIIITGHAANTIQRSNLTSSQKSLIQKIQQEIPTLLNKYQTPGAAVALVDNNGIIWAQGFGVTDKNEPKPVTPETLFSLQSQSKMFTTLGILRAVQSDIISLDKPISFYLPNLKVYSVFEKNPVEQITLMHLLSHTAGFAHDSPVGNNNDATSDFQSHIQSILNGTWLQFPVGKGYQYSNMGIDLAAYVLQKTNKIPFEENMRQQVFIPLRMNSSTFNLEEFLKSPNHAIGYIEGLNPVPYNHAFIPSGGMYSNVIDMAHYLEFQLNDGIYHQQRVLRKDLLHTMLSIPFPQADQTEGYALGIWKGKRLNTLYYSHLGRGFGFCNDLEWYPQYHMGVIVLTNKGDANNTDIKIAQAIIDPFIKHQQQLQFSNLEKIIAGNYISDVGSIKIVNKDSLLFIEGELNEGTVGNNLEKVNEELTYLGNSTFYAKNADAYFKYILKSETGVAALEQVSNGHKWYWNDADNMAQGPNHADWKKYVGTYELRGYVSPARLTVSIKNGYLYFNNFKLREMKSGVFVAANGQVLAFHDDHRASWCNLSISKID